MVRPTTVVDTRGGPCCCCCCWVCCELLVVGVEALFTPWVGVNHGGMVAFGLFPSLPLLPLPELATAAPLPKPPGPALPNKLARFTKGLEASPPNTSPSALLIPPLGALTTGGRADGEWSPARRVSLGGTATNITLEDTLLSSSRITSEAASLLRSQPVWI